MAELVRDQYIVLPSNVEHLKGDKENNPNHFKTPLARPLELNREEWEVALSEINYPHSWLKSIYTTYLSYTFDKLVFEFTRVYYTNISEDLSEEEKRRYREGRVYKDKYHPVNQITENSKTLSNNKELTTPTAVINHLNAIRPEHFKGKFSYQSKTKQVSITLREGEKINFSPALRTLLGFNEKQVVSYTDGEFTNPDEENPNRKIYKVSAPNRPDFQESKYNLFVYCNLVQNTIVGDTEVPLLRTIPVDPRMRNKYVSKTFEELRYIPLASNFFQFIEIQVTDDYGELIKFEFGKVIVTLHLRRRR